MPDFNLASHTGPGTATVVYTPGRCDKGTTLSEPSDITLNVTTTGNADYEISFTQASLSIASILLVRHNLGTYPSSVLIYQPDGSPIAHPDAMTFVDSDTIIIDLTSFVPLAGVWRVSVAS